VQAIADANCHFLTFAVAGPGSMDDQTAFENTGAYNAVVSLPLGCYIICNAAYIASDHLLTIFHGADRLNEDNDNFNYFVSQLCIRIEMAFGLMVTWWQILCSPMQMSLLHATNTLNAISCLHNYTINQWPEIINNAPIIQSNHPHLGYQPLL